MAAIGSLWSLFVVCVNRFGTLPWRLLAHQAAHALLADRFAVFLQVLPEARAPVAVTAGGMKCAQLRAHDTIALRARGERAAPPRVKPAASHTHAAAGDGHRMPGLLRGDERESHRWCLAKKARRAQGVDATR